MCSLSLLLFASLNCIKLFYLNSIKHIIISDLCAVHRLLSSTALFHSIQFDRYFGMPKRWRKRISILLWWWWDVTTLQIRHIRSYYSFCGICLYASAAAPLRRPYWRSEIWVGFEDLFAKIFKTTPFLKCTKSRSKAHLFECNLVECNFNWFPK